LISGGSVQLPDFGVYEREPPPASIQQQEEAAKRAFEAKKRAAWETDRGAKAQEDVDRERAVKDYLRVVEFALSQDIGPEKAAEAEKKRKEFEQYFAVKGWRLPPV
jgi:hypothetical protein